MEDELIPFSINRYIKLNVFTPTNITNDSFIESEKPETHEIQNNDKNDKEELTTKNMSGKKGAWEANPSELDNDKFGTIPEIEEVNLTTSFEDLNKGIGE